MARMSIDDMIARDTRIDRLAKLCGWSRRETRACLEDIWALCYDRVVPYLPAEDIEVTALRDAISPPECPEGFIAALRKVGLARYATASDRNFTRKDGTRVPWPDQNWRDRLYMAGAGERVGYLLTKRSAGSEGGVKSGESRRSKTKQSFDSASSKTQARGNPPDPVPDPVPDSAPDPVPDLEREGAPASPPLTSQPAAAVLKLEPPGASSAKSRRKANRAIPEGWAPRPEERAKASSSGLNVDAEVERFRDHHTAKATLYADWDAAFRTWIANAVRFSGARTGPYGSAERAPRTGRIEPRHHTEYPDGDQPL